MSRYTLPAIKSEYNDYEIVVGWDGTIGNFFGEVRRPRAADDPFAFGGETVISIAAVKVDTPKGADLIKVIEAISDYAIIDHDLCAKLWDDYRKEGRIFKT